MSDNPTEIKPTPARRRPGRHNARVGGQKAYASENDASINDYTPGRTPRTPNKMTSGSPAPASTQVTHIGSSKPRNNRNRAKAKNVPTSPESAHVGHQTPPERSTAIKPGPSLAFAGATFHASPAPSALPIPSFFSKPSTDSPSRNRTTEYPQDPSPSVTDSDIPTPFRPSSAPRPRESPLDFMFRAHREEKQGERKRQEDAGGNSTDRWGSNSSSLPGPLFEDADSRKTSAVPQPRRSHAKQTPNGMESFELQGTPGRLMGPAFSTPYQDRINAARIATTRNLPSGMSPTQHQTDTLQDQTEALKRFLFAGTTSSNSASAGPDPTPRPSLSANSVDPAARMNTNSSGHTSSFRAMEDDLRRILKLDLATDASSPERGVFSR